MFDTFLTKDYQAAEKRPRLPAGRHLRRCLHPSPCQARGRLVAAYIQVRLWPAHQLAGVARVAPYSSRRHSQDSGRLASGHI
jgi:hypothetical protein